jgi:TRAP transporter TAXI family solute receptor
MKKRAFFLAVFISICLAFCLTTAMPDASAKEKIIRVSTFGVGTTGHALVTGLAYAIKEKAGMKMIPVPRETETGRFLSVRVREAELTFTTALSVSAPLAGITEFSAEAWGPQKMYRIWMGPNRAGWVASAKSGIKTLYDVKGKRVPLWPGSSGRVATDSMLAYAKLTWNDVKKVECASFGGQIRAAKIGKTDLWWLGLNASYTIELAGKPQGARVVNIPPEDKEALDRLQHIAPFFSSWYYEGLPGENKNAWSLSYPYVFFCYPWLPSDVAYTLTKAFWEGYDLYKGKHPELKHFTHEYAISLKYLPKGYSPYHPGSVKFFKEIGVWTPKHEEWQQLCLKLGDERENAWNAAKKAAKKKKIKMDSKAWGEFWENYQADYLAERGLPTAPAMRKVE